MIIESLKDFLIFCHIFEKRNLTLAADALFLTPAFISKRLKFLEEEIGARLFHRTTRQLSSTEAGQIFYDQAIKVIELHSEISSFWKKSHIPTGTLKITASASFGRLYLVHLVNDFLKHYPFVSVDLILSDKIIDIVKEGFDLAVRIAALPDSSLISKKIGPADRIICATPEYLQRMGTPRHPFELREHNCLTINNQNLWKFLDPSDDEKSMTVRVKGNYNTSLGDALVESVKDGLGIAMISKWHIPKEIGEKKLIPLLTQYPLMNQPSVYLVYPSSQNLSLKVRCFIDFLQEKKYGDYLAQEIHNF